MGHQLGLGIPDPPARVAAEPPRTRPLMVTLRHTAEQPTLFAGLAPTVVVQRVRVPLGHVAAQSVDPYPPRDRAYNLSAKRRLTPEEQAFHAESERVHAEWEDMRPQDAPNDCRPGMPRGIRPCPWASCRHHLGIERVRAGGIALVHGHVEFDRLEETCSIDVANRGHARTEDVGRYMGVGFERARQVERWAKAKVRKANARLRVLVSEDAEEGDPERTRAGEVDRGGR